MFGQKPDCSHLNQVRSEERYVKTWLICAGVGLVGLFLKDRRDLVPALDEPIEGKLKTGKVDSWDRVLGG